MSTFTTTDKEQIFQQVLDLPELENFLRSEEDSGQPLNILETEVTRDKPHLEKFGMQVIYNQGEADPSDDPIFKFDRLEVNGNTAEVEFFYDGERIRGFAALTKRGDTWETERSWVRETDEIPVE